MCAPRLQNPCAQNSLWKCIVVSKHLLSVLGLVDQCLGIVPVHSALYIKSPCYFFKMGLLSDKFKT